MPLCRLKTVTRRIGIGPIAIGRGIGPIAIGRVAIAIAIGHRGGRRIAIVGGNLVGGGLVARAAKSVLVDFVNLQHSLPCMQFKCVWKRVEGGSCPDRGKRRVALGGACMDGWRWWHTLELHAIEVEV